MKRLGLICLVVLITIGSLGAAYASWSKTLTVSSSVATGTFDVVFSQFTAPAGGVNQTAFSAIRTDDHNYTVSLDNLYPGCNAVFTFTLRNSGSVPAIINEIDIDNVAGLTRNKDLAPIDGSADVTISVQGISTSTTVAAGAQVSGSLTVHTWKAPGDANDAAPSSSGSFTFQIKTAQNTP